MSEKLKVSKEDRRLIELFMGYPEFDLPEYMTWNEIMPMVEKIEGLGYPYLDKIGLCQK